MPFLNLPRLGIDIEPESLGLDINRTKQKRALNVYYPIYPSTGRQILYSRRHEEALPEKLNPFGLVIKQSTT